MKPKRTARVDGRGSGLGSGTYKAVFLDPNTVKEEVRRKLVSPDKASTYKDTGIPSAIVTSHTFETIMLVVIAINTLWIAVDTDFNTAATLMEAHPIFIVAENIFCTIFTTEIVLRFLAYRRKRSALYDGWFLFDSALVSLMILETWIFVIVLAILGGSAGSGIVENASILRIARMFRLARMARMARLLRFIPELMILIKGMLSAARSVFFTLCLLFILLYLYSIGMTQLTVDTNVGAQYFASMPGSMYTLFISGSLLQNVGEICDALGAEHVLFGGVYISFVILSALMVMNMLTGVLCEVVQAVAAIEKDQMLVTYVKGRMQKVIEKLDENGDNAVSRAEFENMLCQEEAVRALTEVGVDVVGLVDFADVIFEEEEELSFGRFMEIVLELRGSNNATVKDVVELRKLIRTSTLDTQYILGRMEKAIEDCVRHVQSIGSQQSKVQKRLTSLAIPSFQADSNHARNTWAGGEEQPGHAKPCPSHENKDSKNEELPRDVLLQSIQRGFADLTRRLDAMSSEACENRADKEIPKDELPATTELNGNSHDFSHVDKSFAQDESRPAIDTCGLEADSKEERYRVRDSQNCASSREGSIYSIPRRGRGDDLQVLRSRVTQLTKHLTSGVVVVNELQRALSRGRSSRRSTSQDGEVS